MKGKVNKKQTLVLSMFIIYLTAVLVFTFSAVNNTISATLGLRKKGLYFGERFISPEDGFISSRIEAVGQWWPNYSNLLIYLVIGIVFFAGAFYWFSTRRNSNKEKPDKSV